MHEPRSADDALATMGAAYRTMLTAEETGGAMAVVEAIHVPGTGPGRHIHEDADETFVVLEGRVVFEVAGRRVVRGAGETAYVPRGTEHAFQVVGTATARMLVTFTPAGFETFLEEYSARRWRMPDDMEAVMAAGARHHLVFTGPPIDAR